MVYVHKDHIELIFLYLNTFILKDISIRMYMEIPWSLQKILKATTIRFIALYYNYNKIYNAILKEYLVS